METLEQALVNAAKKVNFAVCRAEAAATAAWEAAWEAKSQAAKARDAYLQAVAGSDAVKRCKEELMEETKL